MKEKRRLHIHISVENLEESISFYNIQFGKSATKVKEDYAQWLLDDMSLNFAISTRGYKIGLNHLGVQYESDEALLEAQHDFEKAGVKGKVEDGAVCCYKESNKYWVTDPTGIIWENYHSMDDIEVFGIDAKNTQDGCCAPSNVMFTDSHFCAPKKSDNSCCSSISSDCCQ
jgi:catechol 2,3-dioxygenase-like lactoylglutathione lyase family enzyme